MANTQAIPTFKGSGEPVANFREMESHVWGDIDKYFTEHQMAALSEYEKLRLRNMRKSYEMMALLGMPVMKPDFMKTPRVEKKRKTMKPVMKDDDNSSVSIDADEISEHHTTVRRSARASKPLVPYEAPDCTTRLRLKKNDMHSTSKVTEKDPCEDNLSLMKRKRPQTNYTEAGLLADDCLYMYPNDSRDLSPVTSVVLSRINLKDIHGRENVRLRISADNENFNLQAFPKKTKSTTQSSSYTVLKEKECDRGSVVITRNNRKHKKSKSDIALEDTESGGYVLTSKLKKHKKSKRDTPSKDTECDIGSKVTYHLEKDNENESHAASEETECGGYVSTSKLKKHKKSKRDTPSKDTECDIGSKVTYHLEKDNENESHAASEETECGGYVSTSKLKKHKKSKRDTPSKDTECDIGSKVTYHLEKDNENESHAASEDTECGVYVSTSKLKKHKKSKRDTPTKDTECDIGSKVTCHLEKDNENESHAALEDTESDIGSMERSRPKKHKTKSHECKQCGKTFTRSHSLFNHTRIHTGIKPYKCRKCGRSFTESSSLQRHLRGHRGIKPHLCSVCGKRFAQSMALTIHMRCHSGDKPFVCSVCDRKFAQSCDLHTHMARHSGTKKYKCERCGKRFTQSGSLLRHMKCHSGIKPHECSTCGERFVRSDNLHTHKLKHHPC
ncbi:zinc finger protein 436-like [Haliotis rubra]|uniref:zinc finger protein 436-like n=1 Tax=Haliotis rubra TaxID=36100 RepID=UPI001EE4F1B9|nr:zinc finger protein 436-like [Haliotis rubra]